MAFGRAEAASGRHVGRRPVRGDRLEPRRDARGHRREPLTPATATSGSTWAAAPGSSRSSRLQPGRRSEAVTSPPRSSSTARRQAAERDLEIPFEVGDVEHLLYDRRDVRSGLVIGRRDLRSRSYEGSRRARSRVQDGRPAGPHRVDDRGSDRGLLPRDRLVLAAPGRGRGRGDPVGGRRILRIAPRPALRTGDRDAQHALEGSIRPGDVGRVQHLVRPDRHVAPDARAGAGDRVSQRPASRCSRRTRPRTATSGSTVPTFSPRGRAARARRAPR